MTELEAIYERHSVRNYLQKPIEQEKIEQLEAVNIPPNRVVSVL